MSTRPVVLTCLILLLTVAGWGCKLKGMMPNRDGGSFRGDGAAGDGVVLPPDAGIVANPDLPVDRLILAPDSGPDRSPDRDPDLPSIPRIDATSDLSVDISPDSVRDTAIDRSPELADLALDRAREFGDTALSPLPDGSVSDRAVEGGLLSPDLAVDTVTIDMGVGDAGGVTPPPGLSVLAGVLAGPGGLDGVGPSAQFYFPAGVAVDGAGNLYIADSANNTIRKMVLATQEVSTVAGLLGEVGGSDGVGASARFYSPQGLAADGVGNLYVADSANHTIRKIALSSGQVTTIAGSAGQSGHQDARGSAARFESPTGLALDESGNLYVSDLDNTIRRIVLATGDVTTVAGEASVQGSQDGLAQAAHFAQPRGLAADGAGNLYVADTDNCTLRKIVLATGAVTTLAGTPGSCSDQEGIGSVARFFAPQGLALDTAGNLYVADRISGRIRKVVLATAAVSSLPPAPDWVSPNYLANDGAGNLFVTDADAHTVSRFSLATQALATIAGRVVIRGCKDGVGAQASFAGPTDMVGDNQGGVFLADSYWNTIRRIDVGSGRVTTLAGSLEGSAGSKDDTGTAARFASPSALAYDGHGILYVADMQNDTIRTIEISTGVVSTLAGTPGFNESRDGQGSSARFFGPSGLALDGAGNLLVAERARAVIRKIVLADATVTTLAGSNVAYGSADGTGAQARFDSPSGLACDGAGNLYVADTGNCTVRQIVIATGTTTTLVGSAGACEGVDGIGNQAHFQEPAALAMDLAGRLLVADGFDNTVRRIDLATKQVTTIVGHSGRWQTIPGPLPAYVSRPAGLAVLPSGDILISDMHHNVILLARF